MSTTNIGKKAEAQACVYLEMRGYHIIEQNFRRPRCEIDIIADKAGIIYFVEVKYRHTDISGSGFKAITASKLRQMRFATELWVHETKWTGPYQIAAIELAGADFSVMNFIDNAY